MVEMIRPCRCLLRNISPLASLISHGTVALKPPTRQPDVLPNLLYYAFYRNYVLGHVILFLASYPMLRESAYAYLWFLAFLASALYCSNTYHPKICVHVPLFFVTILAYLIKGLHVLPWETENSNFCRFIKRFQSPDLVQWLYYLCRKPSNGAWVFGCIWSSYILSCLRAYKMLLLYTSIFLW